MIWKSSKKKCTVTLDTSYFQIPFIEKVLGTVVGGTNSDNTFISNISNSDIPVPVASSWATMLTGTDTVASHDTTNLNAGASFPKTTSLVGKLFGSELRLKYGFKLNRVADTDTVTIPANSEVSMSISITMKVTDVDLARVIIKEYSLEELISFCDRLVFIIPGASPFTRILGANFLE